MPRQVGSWLKRPSDSETSAEHWDMAGLSLNNWDLTMKNVGVMVVYCFFF